MVELDNQWFHPKNHDPSTEHPINSNKLFGGRTPLTHFSCYIYNVNNRAIFHLGQTCIERQQKNLYLLLTDIKLLPHHAELQRRANRFLSLVTWNTVLYRSPNSRNLELQKISQLFNLRFVWAQLLKK